MTTVTTSRASLAVHALLFGACLSCASCGTGTNGTLSPQDEVVPGEAPSAPEVAPAPATDAPNTQLANPASVNCEKKGGKLEMRTEPAGQFGVCVFPDGSRCEEWRFFRDECKQGECRADDGKCEAKNN